MKRVIRWTAALAWAGVIFYLSSRTWSGPPLFPHADKVIHAFLYAVLGVLFVWALRGTALRGRAMIFPLAASMALIYGALDELHQSFVPGRDPSAADLLFDGIGGVLGAWAAARVSRLVRKEERAC